MNMRRTQGVWEQCRGGEGHVHLMGGGVREMGAHTSHGELPGEHGPMWTTPLPKESVRGSVYPFFARFWPFGVELWLVPQLVAALCAALWAVRYCILDLPRKFSWACMHGCHSHIQETRLKVLPKIYMA